MLDLLKSFSRERDVNIRIERHKIDQGWVCTVTNGLPAEVRITGASAREAIRAALEEAGVELPS